MLDCTMRCDYATGAAFLRLGTGDCVLNLFGEVLVTVNQGSFPESFSLTISVLCILKSTASKSASKRRPKMVVAVLDSRGTGSRHHVYSSAEVVTKQGSLNDKLEAQQRTSDAGAASASATEGTEQVKQSKKRKRPGKRARARQKKQKIEAQAAAAAATAGGGEVAGEVVGDGAVPLRPIDGGGGEEAGEVVCDGVVPLWPIDGSPLIIAFDEADPEGKAVQRCFPVDEVHNERAGQGFADRAWRSFVDRVVEAGQLAYERALLSGTADTYEPPVFHPHGSGCGFPEGDTAVPCPVKNAGKAGCLIDAWLCALPRRQGAYIAWARKNLPGIMTFDELVARVRASYTDKEAGVRYTACVPIQPAQSPEARNTKYEDRNLRGTSHGYQVHLKIVTVSLAA
eukprot:g54580.t1